MKAEFTMHISVTERNVVLTTDTNNMQGVDTQLAINIYKALEGTRGRIKQQIDKFYSNPEGMEQENGGDNTQVDDNTQE
jgi:hypothetical protein